MAKRKNPLHRLLSEATRKEHDRRFNEKPAKLASAIPPEDPELANRQELHRMGHYADMTAAADDLKLELDTLNLPGWRKIKAVITVTFQCGFVGTMEIEGRMPAKKKRAITSPADKRLWPKPVTDKTQ